MEADADSKRQRKVRFALGISFESVSRPVFVFLFVCAIEYSITLV